MPHMFWSSCKFYLSLMQNCTCSYAPNYYSHKRFWGRTNQVGKLESDPVSVCLSFKSGLKILLTLTQCDLEMLVLSAQLEPLLGLMSTPVCTHTLFSF